MNKPICISVAEAAETLGISKTKMYELMKKEDADLCLISAEES